MTLVLRQLLFGPITAVKFWKFKVRIEETEEQFSPWTFQTNKIFIQSLNSVLLLPVDIYLGLRGKSVPTQSWNVFLSQHLSILLCFCHEFWCSIETHHVIRSYFVDGKMFVQWMIFSWFWETQTLLPYKKKKKKRRNVLLILICLKEVRLINNQ